MYVLLFLRSISLLVVRYNNVILPDISLLVGGKNVICLLPSVLIGSRFLSILTVIDVHGNIVVDELTSLTGSMASAKCHGLPVRSVACVAVPDT